MSKTHGQFTFGELCKAVGKSSLYVKNLQRALGLPAPTNSKAYPRQYLCFMEKIVSLRSLNVPQDKVTEMFETEKKILEMLNIDSLSDSVTWYLDACTSHNDQARSRLLLTEFDVGFPVNDGDIQQHLDFSERTAELFAGREMGEDVRRVLAKYHKLLEWIKCRIAQEAPVLRHALDWAEGIIRHR